MNDANPSREQRLEEVLAAYLHAVDTGQAPDRDELLARHPDLADELKVFLSNQGHVQAHGIPYSDVTVPPDGGSTGVGTTVRYIGDYELLQEIARGGMGVVFQARQVSLNRVIALKMILAGTLASQADMQRFRAEAEAAANLDHPNILPIYEVGDHEGQPYFSMKLVEGGSLVQEIPELLNSPHTAAELMARVARAVHFAHQRGILHRDLKPANILLSLNRDAESSERSAPASQRVQTSYLPEANALRSGESKSRPNDLVPYVTDFGLAKRVEGDAGLTQTGTIVGTPSYMAPEQARADKRITTQADVWSLGAILYELLTGRPPFRSATVLDTVLQVLEREPEHPRKICPQVDPDLAVIALKCLEKEPSRRYESAAALADDLERWLRGEPIVARPTGRLERAWKWARRNPALASMALLAVTTLIMMVTTSTFAAVMAQRQREHAEELARQEMQAHTVTEELRKQEADQRQRAERLLYYNSIALAHAAWQGNEVNRAKKALEDCLPSDRRWEWHFLRRLCETGKLTLGAERGGFTAVAISPDGKRIAGGSRDEVVIWEVPSGREVQVLHGTPGRGEMLKLAYSPDGKALAAGRGVLPHVTTSGISRMNAPSELIVWDLATGKPRFSVSGENSITDLIFLPDSKQMVTPGSHFVPFQSLVVRDAFTGREIKTLDKAAGRLALSRDGKQLAVGNIHATTIWNTTDWSKEREEPFGCIHAFSYGPGAIEVSSVDSMTGAVRIWDLEKHQVVQTYNAHAGPVVSLAFVQSRVVTGGLYGRVRVWSRSGRLLRIFRGHSSAIWGIAVSEAPGPFGQGTVATAGGEIKVWAYEEDQEGQNLHGVIWPIAFSPSGPPQGNPPIANFDSRRCAAHAWSGEKRLAVFQSTKDTAAEIRNVSDIRLVCKLEVPVPPSSPIAFRPDIARCAVFGKDDFTAKDAPGTLSVSDTATGRKLWSVHLDRPADWLAFSPRGDYLSAGEVDPQQVSRPIGYKMAQIVTKSRIFRVYDAHAGTVVWKFSEPVWQSEFTGDGRLLIQTGGEKQPADLRCVDPATGTEMWTRTLRGIVSAQVASADGSLLAFAEDNPGATELEIIDLKTGNQIASLKGEPFSTQLGLAAVAFTPDGSRLAVGRTDGSIRLWDPRSSTQLLMLRGDVSAITALAFSPDGNQLVSMSEDFGARWWNAIPMAGGR
jgi:serine/threonine protein kinase/WD40 repeat protein